VLQVGFFKRHKNEELKRLKSTRRTESPFKDTVRTNGDQSQIMPTAEDSAQEHAHDNPMASAHDIDDFGGNSYSAENRDNFLNDMHKSGL